MRRPTLALFLLTLPATLLTSTAAVAQESATHEFVGFSTNAVQGGAAGIFGMNAECAADYGSDARMCNSVEVMRTATPPVTSFPGWVRPVFSPTSPTSTFDRVLDASGRQSSGTGAGNDGRLSCNGWSGGAGFQGLTVTTFGQFLEEDCGLSRPVACCAPIPPPSMAVVPALLPWARGLLVGMLMMTAGLAFLARRVMLLPSGRPRLRG